MATEAKQRLLLQHFQISGALSAAADTRVWVPARSRELSQGATGAETLANAAGTATAGTTTTLTDGGKTWTVNAYVGSVVRITGGTGAGQANYVVSNTATVLTSTALWRTAPDATSVYRIEAPTDELYVIKSIMLSHATTAGILTIAGRSHASLGAAAVVTSQIWGYNSGASVAGNVPWAGTEIGAVRGQIEVTASAAMTGQLTIEGYYTAGSSAWVSQSLI